MFGGNSNWRGPVWMPVNVLIVRGLLNLYGFYGDDFTVECPTGSGNRMTLFEVAKEISRRLASIFLRDESGRRPVYGGTAKFQDDPHWRDLILFYEYFHGDNGAGLGASHQTGWTGLIARLLDLFGRVDGRRRAADAEGEARGPPRPRAGGRERVGGSRCPTPRYPALFQVNTRVRLVGAVRRAGPSGDAGRHHRRGARPAGRGRVRPRLVPRRLADRRGGAARVARRIPSGSPSTAASCPTSARPTSAAPASRSATTASTRTSAATRRSPACANACRRRGLRLILDFVPNHMAPDHPWVAEHPDFFVAGTEEQLAAQPQNYRRLETAGGSRILAYGRDPYFDGWPDTLQLNYGNPALQEAMLGELQRIAGQCDGVRCDMAMLVLPEVFETDVGDFRVPLLAGGHGGCPRSRSRASSSWPRSTGTSSGRSSSRASTTPTTSGSTTASCTALRVLSASTSSPGLDFQDHLARFLENHDEPRAAATFAPDVHRAAAVITFLTPGLRFFHQGQREGKRVRIPIHLGRGPAEPPDAAIAAFYDGLLACLKDPAFRDGQWQLLECPSRLGRKREQRRASSPSPGPGRATSAASSP